MTKKKNINQWKHELMRDDQLGNFRTIPNTNGMYKISKEGVVVSRRFRSLLEGYWMVVKIRKSLNARPFNRVHIVFEGNPRTMFRQLSRVLLMTWVGPPPTETSVAAHRNGVPDDDRLENLLWAEIADVKQSQVYRGTWAHGERAGGSRRTLEQVNAVRKIVKEHKASANLVATALGIPRVRVTEMLNKTWDADKWEGIDDPFEA